MKKYILPILLSMTLCMAAVLPAAADTQDELAWAREERAAASSELASAQAALGSLQSQKESLEYYLEELYGQYNELQAEIDALGEQQTEKKEELIQIESELEEARETAAEQYENMKLRIVFMYEKGSQNMLTMLLGSDNFADFLNTADEISQLSTYDRNRLAEYEDTCSLIETKQEAAEEEAAEIEALITERTGKQGELDTLLAETNDNIAYYASQISLSQAEVSYLIGQISSADSNIANLMARAEREEAAAAAAAQAEREAALESSEESESYNEDGYSETYYEEESDYEESYEEESYEEESYEEYDEPDYEEEEYYEEESSSGSGTYLGNFKLTGYCPCASCCGTANNPTASGVMPVSGHTVAMAGVPFGTQLLINGEVYTVEDLGTPYGHVDIFFDSHDEALSFGLQYADVYQL